MSIDKTKLTNIKHELLDTSNTETDGHSERIRIQDELEELISLLAQTSDSTMINLTTKFEKFESDLEERDDHRWSLFKWFIGILVVVVTGLAPLVYLGLEKIEVNLHDQAKRIAVIESNNTSFVTKRDLIDAIEKRFTQLETNMREVVTTKDLEKLKSEILQVIIRKGGRNP